MALFLFTERLVSAGGRGIQKQPQVKVVMVGICYFTGWRPVTSSPTLSKFPCTDEAVAMHFVHHPVGEFCMLKVSSTLSWGKSQQLQWDHSPPQVLAGWPRPSQQHHEHLLWCNLLFSTFTTACAGRSCTLPAQVEDRIGLKRIFIGCSSTKSSSQRFCIAELRNGQNAWQ